MKKVLILVVSSELPPYKKMIETSLKTWDSIKVEGCETIFYCGDTGKTNKENIIYFPVKECYENMGHKMIMAFDWALKNKEFDYIARVNASCYVDKVKLMEFVQTLPNEDVFAGIEVPESNTNQKWMWGGGQYILSKDIVKKVVDNKELWNHSIMEDVALSHLMNKLEVPYSKSMVCSINQKKTDWLLIGYGCESIYFTDFNDVKKLNQFFFRVKQDGRRELDEYIMKELFRVLN